MLAVAATRQIAYSFGFFLKSGMPMTRRPRAIAKQTSTARRWLTLAAILAFFLQNLAVQTHIHLADLPILANVAAAQTPVPAPLKAQDPIDQCRLCQEMVHAGAVVAPSAIAIPASQILVLAAFVALPRSSAALAPAFAWQSRAPPRR
jgi:hypothetical protein